MATPRSTEIANLALMRLGADTIGNIDEGSVNSGYCKSVYDNCLSLAMREHAWDFATKRETLALSSETNNTAKTYMYQMPSGAERLLAVLDSDGNPTTEDWFIERDQIYTDQETAMAKYIDLNTAVALYDEDFKWLVALHIAWRICLRITQNDKLRMEVYQEWGLAKRQAKAKNARSATSELTESTLWNSVR